MDITLRAWRHDDLNDLVAFANNENVARHLRDLFPHPYTSEDGRNFLRLTRQENPQCTFAIDLNGLAIGSIGVYPQKDVHRLNAEMGYWLAEPYWGRGIMTDAISQMVVHTFEHFPIHRIYAVCFSPNIASQRVLIKSGFQLEAHLKGTIIKKGEVCDEMIYGIRRPNAED